MKTINLREYYASLYQDDCLCEVSDEVADLLQLFRKREAAHRQQVRRYRAYYSLDCDDGLENHPCCRLPSAQETYESLCVRNALQHALQDLTAVQYRRLQAHVVCGESYCSIARREAVSESAVRRSVTRALTQLSQSVSILS